LRHRGVRRDLFITALMLRRGGLDVDVRLTDDAIEVRLDEHRATFPASKAYKAADWLAACAVMHYSESDFAKLWLMLARVAGGAIPFGGR
jgi:hypothetical protein